MPTYIQTADDSNITPSWPNTSVFDKDMVEGASGNGNFQVTIPASSIRSASFITVADKPNSDAFEDGGTQTVELDVSMGDTDFRGRCRMVRVDSSGTILGVKGAFTGIQTLVGGTFTFSPVSPTWTGTESCSDRLVVEWEFENLDSMNHALKLNIRATTTEIITDITEETSACATLIFNYEIPVSFLKSLLDDKQIPVEWEVSAGGVNQKQQMPIGFLSTLSQNKQIITEFLSSKSKTEQIIVEHLLELPTSNLQIPVSFLFTLNSNRQIIIENIIPSSFSNQIITEFLSSSFKNEQILAEFLFSFSKNEQILIESLFSVSKNEEISSEWTSAGVAISQNQGIPIEFLLSFFKNQKILAEFLSSTTQNQQISVEFLSSTNKNQQIIVEFLLNISQNRQISIEFLKGILSNRQIPSEWTSEGLAVSQKQHILVEWLSTINKDLQIPIEWLINLSQNQQIPAEFRIKSSQGQQTPVEYLLSFAQNQQIPAEWTQVTVFTQNQAISVEYLKSLSINNQIILDNLATMASVSIFNTEYLLIMSANSNMNIESLMVHLNDRIMPIEWTGTGFTVLLIKGTVIDVVKLFKPVFTASPK